MGEKKTPPYHGLSCLGAHARSAPPSDELEKAANLLVSILRIEKEVIKQWERDRKSVV